MAEHSTNLLTLLNGHTGYDIGGEDPKLPGKAIGTDKTKLDETADLRDSISALVASGYTSLKPKGSAATSNDVKAHVTRILNTLPTKEAQNLLTHIAIYNQNPDITNLNPTQKLQQFYDINSSNPQTNELLRKVKSFGSGPTSGFQESTEVLNKQLSSVASR